MTSTPSPPSSASSSIASSTNPDSGLSSAAASGTGGGGVAPLRLYETDREHKFAVMGACDGVQPSTFPHPVMMSGRAFTDPPTEPIHPPTRPTTDQATSMDGDDDDITVPPTHTHPLHTQWRSPPSPPPPPITPALAARTAKTRPASSCPTARRRPSSNSPPYPPPPTQPCRGA